MGEHNTPEALVDGDHGMPTEAEIQAMREEAENFRLPAPPPTPVRGRYYLTECEHCGWVGSSEHCGGNCGPDDDDIVCPVCCSSICGDTPDEADTAKHGEAVYQRIVTAEAERDAALAAHQQVTAERDAEKARADRIDAKLGELNAAVRECLPPVDTLIAERQAAEASLATATSELARLRAEGEAKDRRIARLEAALAPFAKAGELFGPRQSNGWDVLIYSPAAGDEYCITADHLRAARAATAREG